MLCLCVARRVLENANKPKENIILHHARAKLDTDLIGRKTGAKERVRWRQISTDSERETTAFLGRERESNYGESKAGGSKRNSVEIFQAERQQKIPKKSFGEIRKLVTFLRG